MWGKLYLSLKDVQQKRKPCRLLHYRNAPQVPTWSFRTWWCLMIFDMEFWKSHLGDQMNLYVQSVLYIPGFYIHRFNHLEIENIQKKLSEISKRQHLNFSCVEHYTKSVQMKWCKWDMPCFSLYAKYRLYTNITPFYIRDLSIHGFWDPQESWNQSPLDTEGWPYSSG